MTTMVAPIIGQEAFGPQGLGRVTGYNLTFPNQWISIMPYVQRGEQRFEHEDGPHYSPGNVWLIPLGGGKPYKAIQESPASKIVTTAPPPRPVAPIALLSTKKLVGESKDECMFTYDELWTMMFYCDEAREASNGEVMLYKGGAKKFMDNMQAEYEKKVAAAEAAKGKY
ncbi:hypothetical protein [Burkholderia phage BCSR5]|nr:hypothetical protein [Burkholderia phage BCSR5]